MTIAPDVLAEACKAFLRVYDDPSAEPEDYAREVEAAISAAVLMERERCAKIAEEIAYIEGTDFGSVNAIRYGWPEIDQCQHGKSTSQACTDCPPEARQKWWEVEAIS